MRCKRIDEAVAYVSGGRGDAAAREQRRRRKEDLHKAST
jgi:hypothetical protein